MAAAVLSADKDAGSHTPPSSGSSSEGSDFVILPRPSEGAHLGSPNDFQVNALATPFANGGEVSTMMNADHLMTAFNGLKQENAMLKGQLTEMNKAMQSRIVEIQTMREAQHSMNADLKDKHQKAKKAVTHYQEQNKNLSERLKEILEKDNQSTLKVEKYQKEISQLQMELRKSQEDLKSAQETRGDIKRELQQMEEAGRQSEEALQKVNASELQRLQQAIKRKDEEKQDLLKMNQELQQKLDNKQQKSVAGLQEDEGRPRQDSKSLPSGQSEGEFIEEEQGFSLMHDSKEFDGRPLQGFNQDILKQLQNERERSDKVSAELKEERTHARKVEADLQDATRQLMERSEIYEVEVSEIHQKHKAVVDDLLQQIDELSTATQEERHDSGAQLKHQVKSLVAELNTKESDIKDRDHTIDNLHAEIAALRTKVTMYHDDMEKERDQNTELVNTLETEIYRLKRSLETHSGELQQKDTMYRGEKQKALHSQLELDRLQEEYDQLFGDYDNLTRNYEELRAKFEKVQPMLAKQREIVENQDSLVARLLSAEEAIKAKDEQNQQLQEDMKQMKNDLETIPVLRAQAEVYKADFDAERAAREKAHADKEVLLNELETLRAECENAQQEAANQAQPRVLEMQRRHGGDAGAGQQGQDDYGLLHTGGMDPWGTFQPYGDNNAMGIPNDFYSNDQAGANRDMGLQPGRNVTCPKCMEQFPDMDTLQIHMIDCIQ
ncbi:uncharacterized protein [Amphiura filiformis]|uniref:uncharacterized protein isoform X2 n=1 Tax=Amphiura filiformis TaxID=82378 RepID=UPI003B2245E5